MKSEQLPPGYGLMGQFDPYYGYRLPYCQERPEDPRDPNVGIQPGHRESLQWNTFNTRESLSNQQVMLYFKINPCAEMQQVSGCPYGLTCTHYHSANDRRRPPFMYGKLVYRSSFCPSVASGQVCSQGDRCQFSHTAEESLYHPAKYKTAICPSARCVHEVCPYAHRREDLRSTVLVQAYLAESPISPPMSYLPLSYPLPQFTPMSLPSISGRVSVSVSVPAPVPVPVPASSVPALDADLATFKTLPCTVQYQHNHKHCPYYHSAKDRRRPPGKYSPERCEENESNRCMFGDNCPRSHSMVERLYHPDKYKTKYCNNFPNRLHECEYGNYCCFAHGNGELKVERIHELQPDADFFMFYFKTAWCPYNHEHNKAMCVYAHNWQDFRRKPHLFRYSSEVCPNWQSEIFISEYKEGCSYEEHCLYSHGWKEQLFHPHVYKASPCPDLKKCQRGYECPFYHDELDRRVPNPMMFYRPRAREVQPISTNPSSTNLNTLKELEIQQCSLPRSLLPASSSFVTSITQAQAYTAVRRYSAEQPYGVRLTEGLEGKPPTRTQEQHSGPMLPPERRISYVPSSPLKHIREESPDPKESPRETNEEFGFFALPEDIKVTPSALYSPGKATTDNSKQSTGDDPSPALGMHHPSDSSAGYKSCPATPIVKRQSFGKPLVFQTLHLDDDEPPAKEQSRIEKELLKVKELLTSLKLEKYYGLFAAEGITTNEMMLMMQDQYKSIGLNDDGDIKTIMDKIKENLEHHFEEQLESPRMSS